MKKVTKSEIHEILMKYYPQQLEGAAKIEIRELEQGYMNTAFTVAVLDELSLQKGRKFVVVIYNVNRYNDQSKKFLTQTYQAASALERSGLPARTAVQNFKSQLISEVKFSDGKIRLIGLYRYLPGSTIPWEGYTRRHLRALGRTMAEVHKIWSKYDGESSDIPCWGNYLESDCESMFGYFNANENFIKNKLKVKLNSERGKQTINELRGVRIEVNSQCDLYQLIHCDFVRGNILFSDQKKDQTYPITGILDFEKVMHGPREADLGRTLAFLLVDCKYKTRQEIDQYFLREGYLLKIDQSESYSKLSFNKLQTYINYFWMRDFWKLLQCNPYEDLSLNFHYGKTLQELKKQKLILSIDP